jgi:hypothetical protein
LVFCTKKNLATLLVGARKCALIEKCVLPEKVSRFKKVSFHSEKFAGLPDFALEYDQNTNLIKFRNVLQ